jgi:NADH:flavin oxidoreductase / NADH oxidase family
MRSRLGFQVSGAWPSTGRSKPPGIAGAEKIDRMGPRHAILFEPVRIGRKTMPNRLCQVPHASGSGSRQPRTQAAFRAVKSEGGWGGVCVERAWSTRRCPVGQLTATGSFDGHRLAREIGLPDAAAPGPFRREFPYLVTHQHRT